MKIDWKDMIDNRVYIKMSKNIHFGLTGITQHYEHDILTRTQRYPIVITARISLDTSSEIPDKELPNAISKLGNIFRKDKAIRRFDFNFRKEVYGKGVDYLFFDGTVEINL